MAWTTPRDWTAGEFVTEAMMDTHIRDNLNYVYQQHKIKSADQSVVSSTTFVNDNDLILTVLANEKWLIDMYLVADAAPAGGLKVQWTFPSGTAMTWSGVSGATGGIWTNDSSNSGGALKTQTDTQSYASAASGTIWGVNIKAIVLVSTTAGNVTLQWAQNASNADNTTLKAGSCFVATRLNT